MKSRKNFRLFFCTFRNFLFMIYPISLFSMNFTFSKNIRTLVLCLLLLHKTLFSQITNVVVTPFKVDQKIITASINNKLQATFVLKQFEVSDFHSSVYSVKGYYYLDNDKYQIPLSGIYSGDYVLTLYAFADESKDDSLINLEYSSPDFWKSVEHFKNMKLFKEKFRRNQTTCYLEQLRSEYR